MVSAPFQSTANNKPNLRPQKSWKHCKKSTITLQFSRDFQNIENAKGIRGFWCTRSHVLSISFFPQVYLMFDVIFNVFAIVQGPHFSCYLQWFLHPSKPLQITSRIWGPRKAKNIVKKSTTTLQCSRDFQKIGNAKGIRGFWCTRSHVLSISFFASVFDVWCYFQCFCNCAGPPF